MSDSQEKTGPPPLPADAPRSSSDGSAAARQFWELWQRDKPPNLDEFVARLENLKPAQLAAILCVDLRERWRRKERVQAEEYLRRFPKVQDDREAALDVVYSEFLIRDELGEAPGKSEFSARFPHLSIDLSRQIEMHRLLESDEDSLNNKITLDRATTIAATDSPEPSTWPTLPGFEILGRLGRGGMGVVYKAWQDRLYRVVAVKMLHAGNCNDAEALARFRVEGEATARLAHANILQIYEVGEHDGRPYLVMEYADAGSLAQKLAGTPWPPNEAAALVETLARAVHCAHQRGVVHRDLTPGNVLMFADGTPKLCDFGLAKLLVGGQALTQTGDVVGTPSYMSPEQASGTSHASGPAIDIYALGAILFEMLTGRPPFRAATALETLAQVVHTDPVPPRQLQPSVPRDLETICLKCLRKEPTRRYASAEKLADDLRHFLKAEPIEARPVGPLERVWRWGWREPGWAAAIVLVILIAIGAVVTASLLADGLARAQRAHEHTKEARRETQLKLYRSKVDEAKARRMSGRAGQRTVSLASLKEAQMLAHELDLPDADFHELRNEMVACLALPDLQMIHEWAGFPEGSFGVDFDEEMSLYARSDVRGNISVRRLDRDKQVGVFSTGQHEPVLVRFNQDGRSLAAFSGKHLHVWRFQREWSRESDAELTGKLIVDVAVGKGHSHGSRFAFGAAGNQIAVVHSDQATISVCDAKTGAELYRGQPAETITQLAFHPLEQVLALASGKEALFFDLRSKTITGTIPHPDTVDSMAWGPEARVLVTSCEDKLTRVWQVAEARFPAGPPVKGEFDKVPQFPPRLANRWFSPATPGMDLALNRTGAVLGSSNLYDTLRLLDMRSGQQLVMPLPEAGQFRFSTRDFTGREFQNRDDRLATTAPGGKARVYQIILGREFRRLPAYNRHLPGSSRSVVFHPSGRLLIGSSDHGLTVFNTRSATATSLHLGHWTVPLGFDAEDGLITESAAGYHRWPYVKVAEGLSLFRQGPPQLLASAGNSLHAALGGKGKVLAIPERDQGARVVLLDDGKRTIQLGPQKDVRYCAVSPDGRFVATGTHGDPGQPGAVIWNAQTGERVHDIPALPRFCDVGFSPDGRWLITSGGGCKLWEVGSWKDGPFLGGIAFTFAANGKWLAVEGEVGQVRLIDPATAKELVRLTAHGELHSMPCCFSPDGSQLVVYGTESQALHVWDLRGVRAVLRHVQLDWEGPDFAPLTPMQGPPRLDLVRD